MNTFKTFIQEDRKKKRGRYTKPDERQAQKLAKSPQYYEGPYKLHGKTRVPYDKSIFLQVTQPKLWKH